MRPHRVGRLSGLLVLLAWVAAAPVHAAEDITVRAASATVRGGMLELDARVAYPVDNDLRGALAAGATVDLELQVALDRVNPYWFDQRLLLEYLQRELSWNGLSQRYVLKDTASDQQRTFATLEEAMAAAGTVTDWKVAIGQRLEPAARYMVSVRARLRRGRLPSGLRALTFWTRYWSRSDWYSWPLPR